MSIGIMIGFVLGIATTGTVIYFYSMMQEVREEEARQREIERQQRQKMRQEMNKPRDPMTRKIMEETRKGLQRRDQK